MKHKFHDCKSGHPNGCPDDDQGRDCIYDVLSVCSVCNLAEGELTEDCPGVKVNYQAEVDKLGIAHVGYGSLPDGSKVGWPEYTDAKGWHVVNLPSHSH